MKASSLRIGPKCTVGNMAVILYDTQMQEGAIVGPLSLLMKGESLAAHSQWQGIPTAAAHFSLPPCRSEGALALPQGALVDSTGASV